MPKLGFSNENRTSILAVSQNVEDRTLLETELEGWSVRQANTWREALDMLRTSVCKVILCDERLPDGSWRDLVTHAAGLVECPPVIVMSPVADESMWADVLRDGGFDLLSKPLQLSDLRRALPSATRHPRLAHAATA